MKTIINKFLLLVMLFAGAASLHGCSDPDGIIEDIAYGREFSPLNFTHTLSNNVNVTFSWTVMAGIADYTLTLSYADGEGGVYDQVDLIAPLDGDGNTVKTMEYSFRELPGNREWIAELVAVSQRAGVADSKPAACAFATGVENLFLNDGKMGDGDVTATTAMLRWVAGSNVTHLDVTPDVGLIKLTSAQIAAGEYELTGLVTGTSYTVGLLRDEAVRGTISFVASDKIDVDVVDKGATTITLAWGADRQVTSLVLTGDDDERNVTLTDAEVAAHTYTFEGLKARTEYSISVYIAGVESGSLVVTTLGQSSLWDFTTGWQPVSWETDQTIDGLTILAASGKNVEIREDADYGCNYLDLRGKSTVKEGEAPSQRAVQFSVVGEGVIAIDCYANGAGRNFYAHVDALGKSFGPVEAPTADNRGKVYIPCPGIPASAKVSIWTDATINHIYSIGWYEGTEAPGQNATPLDAPVVTANPASCDQGRQHRGDLLVGRRSQRRDLHLPPCADDAQRRGRGGRAPFGDRFGDPDDRSGRDRRQTQTRHIHDFRHRGSRFRLPLQTVAGRNRRADGRRHQTGGSRGEGHPGEGHQRRSDRSDGFLGCRRRGCVV